MVPYAECELGNEEQEFTETKMVAKLFVEKTCSQALQQNNITIQQTFNRLQRENR